MNNLILNELVTIKWILFGVLLCLVLFLIWAILSMTYSIRARKTEFEAAARNAFISEAHQYEDAGEYEDLFQLAWNRVNSYPHDPNAHWYLAMAYYRRKEWGAALTAFKQLQNLDPAWQKYAVDEYLEEIKQHLTGPKGDASKR